MTSPVAGDGCRNARNMPDSVRDAVKKIIMTGGEKTENEAEKYLDEMDRTRRYQTETWS